MNKAEFLKRENATMAMLALLSYLEIVNYDTDLRTEGNYLMVSLNQVHKFIRRQYNIPE